MVSSTHFKKMKSDPDPKILNLKLHWPIFLTSEKCA
jgi:hypothetical protein